MHIHPSTNEPKGKEYGVTEANRARSQALDWSVDLGSKQRSLADTNSVHWNASCNEITRNTTVKTTSVGRLKCRTQDLHT